MTSAATATVRIRTPHPAGVWKFRGKLLNRNAYYAVATGERVIGNCIYLVSDEETDAQLVWRLARALREVERPNLRVVPRTVIASIDGPSHSHPAIAELEESGKVIPLPLMRSDQPTPGLYERIYKTVYGHYPDR